MEFEGGCHCGNIRLTFKTAVQPSDMVVRACQCGFCRKHNTLAAADPDGRLNLQFQSEVMVNRYRFGLETAEYLICRQCGVYVAAITLDAPPRALVIVNALDDRALFTGPPTSTNYDRESENDRRSRRMQTWTPLATQ